MAKLVGLWIYEVPRKPSDDVQLLGGATLILTEADKRKLGDGFMRVFIRVKESDSAFDNTLYSDDSFQLGPGNLNIGPNTFGFSATLKHKTVEESEPWYEEWAELYFRLAATGAGDAVKTKWANSPKEDVRYE
jgi:hypothetical protein